MTRTHIKNAAERAVLSSMSAGPRALTAAEPVLETQEDHERETVAPPAGYERSKSAVQLRVAKAANGADIAALDIGRDHPSTRPEPIRETEERLLSAIKTRDLPNALTLASVLVYMDPTHEIAVRIKDRCAKQLEGTRTRAFPRHDAVPKQCVPWSELRRRTLSRHEAYLLYCIDGQSTVEEIVDASAMPPLIAFETLDALIREGIVDLA
jgi:hypothetical protein